MQATFIRWLGRPGFAGAEIFFYQASGFTLRLTPFTIVETIIVTTIMTTATTEALTQSPRLIAY